MPTQSLVIFRTSGWDTPWWANLNREPGRFNAAWDGPVQYWCLHPLGPYAEYLRGNGLRAAPAVAELQLRIWAARIDTSVTRVSFDNAEDYGMQAYDLVADDHGPCRVFGRRCLVEPSAPKAIRVPSAALPGTDNVVLFGGKVSSPFTMPTMHPDDVPTSPAAERAGLPPALLDSVRHFGSGHMAFDAWADGTPFTFKEPLLPGTL